MKHLNCEMSNNIRNLHEEFFNGANKFIWEITETECLMISTQIDYLSL